MRADKAPCGEGEDKDKKDNFQVFGVCFDDPCAADIAAQSGTNNQNGDEGQSKKAVLQIGDCRKNGGDKHHNFFCANGLFDIKSDQAHHQQCRDHRHAADA